MSFHVTPVAHGAETGPRHSTGTTSMLLLIAVSANVNGTAGTDMIEPSTKVAHSVTLKKEEEKKVFKIRML